MKRFAVALFLIFAVNFVYAQTQTSKPVVKPAVIKKAVASANDELIALAKLGMTEEILLAKVAETKAAGIKFDTSAEAIGKLQAAGMNQKIIAAIFGGATVAVAPPTPATQVTVVMPAQQNIGVSLVQANTLSADGITEAGIYLVDAKKLTQLEPAVFSAGKSGGKFLHSLTTLFKASIKAVVRSERANQRLQMSMPVFYFYFENRGAGLSNTGGFTGFLNGASSPNEFVLVRMKVDRNERSIVTGEDWTFGDSNGVRSKDIIDFSIEKLRTGVYKVTPRTPLTAGEYCFFYASGNLEKGMGSGKLFDFGVDPGASVQ